MQFLTWLAAAVVGASTTTEVSRMMEAVLAERNRRKQRLLCSDVEFRVEGGYDYCLSDAYVAAYVPLPVGVLNETVVLMLKAYEQAASEASVGTLTVRSVALRVPTSRGSECAAPVDSAVARAWEAALRAEANYCFNGSTLFVQLPAAVVAEFRENVRHTLVFERGDFEAILPTAQLARNDHGTLRLNLATIDDV